MKHATAYTGAITDVTCITKTAASHANGGGDCTKIHAIADAATYVCDLTAECITDITT